MPKISKYEHGATGMSDYEPVRIRREEITGNVGGAPSAGKSFSPSSENETTPEESSTPNPPKPAPMTESHSSQTEKATSDAPSTAGNTRETRPPRSAKPAKKAAKKSATVRNTDGDDEEEW